RWTCDSKAVIEWRYIDGSKNIVDLRLKDEDDVVHHLEQEPAAVGAFYSDGRRFLLQVVDHVVLVLQA
ncbi:MliC family protein, partial [Pseudomonas aeruginosa]